MQDQAMIESIMAFPAETEGLGNQPLEPTVLPDGTKHFELTASIVDWEVARARSSRRGRTTGWCPGRASTSTSATVSRWSSPTSCRSAPTSTGTASTSPTIQDGVAPITQDLVTSGETYTYRFTVTEPAIGMYHAHAHGDKAIPNGLFGTMYVGDDRRPVRHDGVGHRDPGRPRRSPRTSRWSSTTPA